MGPLWAATDINKASAAELDGIKGIGPALSGRMLEERKKGPFKDWNDLIQRVQGVGPGNAARYSEAGLTVNGSSFKPASADTAKAAAPAAPAPAKAPAKP
jgi:competence protein ComEA